MPNGVWRITVAVPVTWKDVGGPVDGGISLSEARNGAGEEINNWHEFSANFNFPGCIGDVLIWNHVLLPGKSVEDFDKHASKLVFDFLSISIS